MLGEDEIDEAELAALEESDRSESDTDVLLDTDGKPRDSNADLAITGGIGTSLFMAPEVIICDRRSLAANPFASDVYSYSMLAWQVLADELPFAHDPMYRGLDAKQIKELVVSGHRPEIPLRECWPEGIGSLLVQCWAALPAERPSFDWVIAELKQMALSFDHYAMPRNSSGMLSSDTSGFTGSAASTPHRSQAGSRQGSRAPSALGSAVGRDGI